ncbi:hypothetical protein ILUMI_24068 [Ignelater luminosus]|uniref:Uncharacterized protein n=1 Tax=Ignelater luminosus TaxID=2038154 RepID=A0A8K0G108_IGNLU|nr:hypothetical protein ILUMI_24068 [Ignelater luminosus]
MENSRTLKILQLALGTTDNINNTNELTIVDGCSAVVENTNLDVEFNKFLSSTSDNNEGTGLYVNEIQSLIVHEDMNLLSSVCKNDGGTELHEYDATQPDTVRSKKSYLHGLVERRQPKKRRATTDKNCPIKPFGYDCFLPKTDGAKNEGNLDQSKYDLHRLKNGKAREAKKKAIDLASDTVLVATIDVQSIILALADLTKVTDIEIEQIILEKRHTMMKVDSVHSTLEQLFRPPIYTPSDYISRIHQARKKQPYIINYLYFSFFKDYENLPNNYKSIRPRKKSGDAAVNEVRGLLYKHEEIFYKLRHSED